MGMIMKILQIILYSIILDVNISLSEPDRHCLDCICQASSGCKRNIQCHNSGNGQYYCGPYQISWAYWADAGKPGDAGFANDFEQCLVKKSCSEAAVRGYMKKYGNDCNGDGHVDCLDYAAIHKAGPSGSCQPSWLLESKYWLEFQQCYSHSSSSSSLSTETSFRDNSNSPYNTMIEIPRNKPPFLPPLPPPLILPPVHARASASVPGASASASATAGFDSNNGNPLTVASTSIGNGNDEIGTEIVETYPPLPSPPRRLGSFNRPNQIPPIPGVFVNKPQPSSPVLVPSANFNRIKPIRFNFPNSPSPSIRREDYSSAINSVSNVEEPEEIVVSEAQELIPYDCLQCLCHASSKCDLNKGCDGAYCGPYLLSWGYWADGGKPGGEYATCSKQKPCSETAIQGYMAKWKRDCNHDGTIDCIDFALIHKLGPHGCEKIQALQSTDYWNQFSQCHQTESGNKPARSTRPVLVEVPRPQPIISTRSSEPFIRPSPNSNEDESNIEQPQPRGVVIRVNNRDLINTNNNHLRSPPPPRPPTRIDLGTLNTSQPIIIRIKPPINSNDPSRINIPETRPRPPALQPKPVEIIEEPPTVIEPRRPVISDNDDFFSQPRPLDQPSSSHNEQPNVSEIPRQPSPLPPSPPRPKPLSRQNATTNNLVTVECLECICYASSKCNPSIGCRSEGTGKYVCGSYQVDWEYWMEAGKPGNRADLSNVENFQMCMNNRECADKTVTEYLKRFRKDCNEDGHIDCNDYAALHIGGPKHCGAQWYLDSKYYSDFRECFDF